MKLLVDTHAFLWAAVESEKLSQTARDWWLNPVSELIISPASLWEIAIKVSIGKLQIDQPLDEFFDNQLLINDIRLLQELPSHAVRLASLPFIHRDPFDRMIVAQALCENLPLLSADAPLDNYGIQRIW